MTVKNYDGAFAAAKHLAELGHRRIAFVGEAPDAEGDPLGGYVERERFDAYRDVVAGLGAFDETLVMFGQGYQVDEMTAQGHGYRAVKELLARPDAPTAVLAGNDILAAGALQAIHEKGFRVPDDLSVIGFDDTLAEYLSPLLTSVRLPARRLGEAAARLAIDESETDGEFPPQVIELEAEFMQRQSTASPKT